MASRSRWVGVAIFTDLHLRESGVTVAMQLGTDAAEVGVPPLPSRMESCWSGVYTRDFCCDPTHGPQGNPGCWGGEFNFDTCCTHPVEYNLDVSKTTHSGSEALSNDPLSDPSEFHAEVMHLEASLGSQLDSNLARGLSMHTLEMDLRRAATSAEDRQVLAPTAHAFLALIYHRQGKKPEATEQMRLSHQRHKFHISSNGAWVGPNAAGYHFHDSSFSSALIHFFHGRYVTRVADFGCGLGLYVRDMRQAGIRAGGFDGNPVTREISEGRCGHEDLSREFDLATRWGWLLSLEVAEHIPPEFEATFLDNLDRHNCHGLVISWGNQAGEGHVNLRPRSEVENIFHERGYETLQYSTQALREAATLPWLKNVWVFKRLKDYGSLDGCGIG